MSPPPVLAAGQTPLHYAARKGSVEIVRELRAAGAWVDLKDESGSTPLQEAAKKGHVAVVEALLAAGASVNLQNSTGTHLNDQQEGWVKRGSEGIEDTTGSSGMDSLTTLLDNTKVRG